MHTTNRTLADRLRGFAFDQVETLAHQIFVDWQIPRVFGGHLVGADVRADLAFTLGLLADGGIDTVAHTPIDDAIGAVLQPIDGAATHTFYSYRVAETVARRGPLTENPLLEGWTATQREQLALACDSTEWIPRLGEPSLPVNYAAVLARCELARRNLGLDVDEAVLADLLGRAAELFARNPTACSTTTPRAGAATTSTWWTSTCSASRSRPGCPADPGLFETPVDRPLTVGTPMVVHRDRTYAAGGVPIAVHHTPGQLRLDYEGFAEMGGSRVAPARCRARAATVRVDRRTLHVDEALTFDRVPDAVVLQVAEATDRPLVVRAGGDHPATTTVVDTAGINEWRSFWGELPRVHQIDLEPAAEVAFSWSVTPVLRVATDSSHHRYVRSLYDAMAPWVVDRDMHRPAFEHPRAVERLRAVDVYHLHWPEWVFDTDLDAAQRFLDRLDAADTRLVWTQHNLLPHREGDFADLFALIAGHAHGVIHHCQWGQARSLAARDYRPGAHHAVIPHGHWADADTLARAATVSAELQATSGWHEIAATTRTLLEDVVADRP